MRAYFSLFQTYTLLDKCLQRRFRDIALALIALSLMACSSAPELQVEPPVPANVAKAKPMAKPIATPIAKLEAPKKPIKTDTAQRAENPQVVNTPKRGQALWVAMREGFSLPELNDKRVQYYERQFTARPEYLARIFKRAQWFLPSILADVKTKGLPTEIALLPAIESAFVPDARSRTGASGLWQFIASTGRLYDMHENWWYDGRRDFDLSTAGALQFLSELNARFNGDWLLSIAGYNAGGSTIQKAMRRNQRANKSTDFSALKLSRETTHYVPKLIALRNIVRNPGRYNVSLPPMPNAPAIASVDAGTQIDIGLFAQILDTNKDALRFLNRAYKRGVTPPDGPHILQVPSAKLALARQALSRLDAQDRVHWAHHRIAAGEVLSNISKRYKVSVAALKSANKLRSDLIHPGKVLRIPVSSPQRKQAINSAAASPLAKGESTLTHQVSQGDTLWDIARYYGVKVAQISKWNKLENIPTLRLGQKLLIYPHSS